MNLCEIVLFRFKDYYNIFLIDLFIIKKSEIVEINEMYLME